MNEPTTNPSPETTPPEIQPEVKAADAAAESETKEEQPMIEVHAPHEGVHSWKDVLIHIGIIVAGLLIAIGLDEAVVHLHQRHQLNQAREELAAERAENQVRVQLDLEEAQKLNAQLDNDIALLREHQRTHAPLTAKLDYNWTFYRILNGAWLTVQQNGTVNLMPYQELRRDEFDYQIVARINDTTIETWVTEMGLAAAIAKHAPDGNLSPQDTEDLIRATYEVEGDLAVTVKLLGFFQEGPTDVTRATQP